MLIREDESGAARSVEDDVRVDAAVRVGEREESVAQQRPRRVEERPYGALVVEDVRRDNDIDARAGCCLELGAQRSCCVDVTPAEQSRRQRRAARHVAREVRAQRVEGEGIAVSRDDGGARVEHGVHHERAEPEARAELDARAAPTCRTEGATNTLCAR